MTGRTRVLVLLGILAASIALVYWVAPFGGSTGAGAGSVPGGGRTEGRAAADGGVTDIRLELLQRERGALRGPDRNPFRFESRASAAPVRPRPTRVVPVDTTPAGPVPPPPPPPIPLRFIGFLQPKGGAGRVAVLSDGRGNVFDGREGDIIEGRYRLLRVGIDSADLIYLDGRGRQTIRLSGQ